MFNSVRCYSKAIVKNPLKFLVCLGEGSPRRSDSPLTQAGAPLHSHWLATRRVTGRRPRCIYWKCLRFWDTLTLTVFKQLHGHKIPMNATNSPDRLNLYIFSLNLSYHSFVSVHDIQQKRLLNKISVYAFTHPGGHHRVANATLSVACTCDDCAQLIHRIQKSLLPGTMHFS